ncbi:MAG: hypothetical protein AAF907_12120 [Planctomycetota bacterium]
MTVKRGAPVETPAPPWFARPAIPLQDRPREMALKVLTPVGQVRLGRLARQVVLLPAHERAVRHRWFARRRDADDRAGRLLAAEYVRPAVIGFFAIVVGLIGVAILAPLIKVIEDLS